MNKGSPIRVNGQVAKDIVPNFSFLGSFPYCLRVRFVRPYSNPSFRLVDSAPPTGGGSVSHPSGSSTCGGESFSLLKTSPPLVFLPNDHRARLVLASPENVQCRSVLIQCLRVMVRVRRLTGTRVQPVFDSRHGRIADKIFSRSPLRC